MSEMQYIGARYVPKVYTNPNDGTSNWKSGVEYEALTIVTYNGDSYTSKKAVPNLVGNPADNSVYWVKTGDFNASLLALQNRVNNIVNNEIPALDNKIDGVDNRLDTKIDSVDNRLNTKIDNVDKRRNKFTSRGRLILIGDSYAGTSKWVDYIGARLGISSSNVHTNYEPSTGFSTDLHNQTPNGFLRLITNLVSTMSDTEKSEVTDVVIAGGYNDATAYPNSARETAISTGINDVKNFIANNLPNAVFYVSMIGISFYGYGGDTSMHTIEDLEYCEYMYKLACYSNNIPYLSSGKYAFALPLYNTLTNMMNDDGFHPKGLTGPWIAAGLASDINGDKDYFTCPKRTSTKVLNFMGGGTSNITIHYEMIDKQLIVSSDAVSGSGMSVTAQGGKMTTVGYFGIPDSVWFNKKFKVSLPSTCVISGTDTVTTIILEYYQNNVTVYASTPVGGTMSAIEIPALKFSVDAYNK